MCCGAPTTRWRTRSTLGRWRGPLPTRRTASRGTRRGQKRRGKAARGSSKKQQQVRWQRRDLCHKTALALVRQYDVIYVEAIQAAHLSRRPAPVPDGNGAYEHNGAAWKVGHSKSSRDARRSQFLYVRAHEAACGGTSVEAVHPANTSQDCSGCGARICVPPVSLLWPQAGPR